MNKITKITRRQFLTGLGTACGALLAGTAGMWWWKGSRQPEGHLPASSGKKKPNIIYILADDLGYGDLGCYGQQKIKTPNLDRMAAEGLRFTQHYSGAPVCGPSRACLMTGQHQGTGYIKGNPVKGPGTDTPLRPEDRIIPELLKDAGYDTACIGKWGLGNVGSTGFPTRKGFDYFLGYDSHVSAHNYYPPFLWENDQKHFLPKDTYSHDVFAESALKWVGDRGENPFFLYLAFTIPHSPHNPPSEEPYQSESWMKEYRNYAAMITRMDGDIGRLLDLLKTKGIDDDTLVFFSSDNGPGSEYNQKNFEMVRFFQSAGELRGIKRDVYDGGVRVPLIVRWPGKVKSGESKHISAFQDILPTMAQLSGAPIPNGIDGISMLPVLLDKEGQLQHDYLYWELTQKNGKNLEGRQSCFDIKNGWKGVRYGKKGRLELYKLDQDMRESDNVADQHPDVVERLSKYLNTVRSPSTLWPMPDKGWFPPKWETGS